MHNIEIEEETDTYLILFDSISRRFFLLNYQKISKNSIITKQIIYDKILIKDYTYILTPTSLDLKFKYAYEKKHTFYDIKCDEIFVELENIEDDDITNEEYKKYIYSLKNRVNNLNSQILLLEKKKF